MKLFKILIIVFILTGLILPNASAKKNYIVDEKGRVISAIVKYDNTGVYDKPEGKEIGKLKFFDLIYVAAEKEVNGNIWLQSMKKEDGDYIKEEKWILSTKCLTSDNYKVKKTKNNIYIKYMIVNPWKKAKPGQEEELSAAPVYAGPGVDYKKITELSLFNFYLKLDEVKTDKGSFVLLSRDVMVRPNESRKHAIVGWVRKEWLREWNTRACLEFRKDNFPRDPIKIFADEKTALADLFFEEYSKDDVIGIEDTTYRYSYYSPRYPVFEQKNIKTEDGVEPLYKIGYLGHQYKITEKGIEKKNLDPETEKKVLLLRQLTKNINNLDIVFAIDATRSMQPYFKSASDGVKNIISKIKEDNPSKKIKISVLFYRDTQIDKDKAWKFYKLDRNETDIYKALETEKAEDAGGDYLESCFFGIKKAIELNKEYYSDTAMRILIHIGDYGDHGKDKISSSEIAQLLDKYNFEYYSIQVVPDEKIKTNKDIYKFKKDALNIISKLKQRRQKKYKDALADLKIDLTNEFESKYLNELDPEKVSKIIQGLISSADNISEQAKSAYEEIISGVSIKYIKSKYGVYITDVIIRQMQQNGLDPAKFLDQRFVAFEEGYVHKKDLLSNEDVVKEYLLVQKQDLHDFIGFLNRITRFSAQDRKDIEQLYLREIQEAAGEHRLNIKENISPDKIFTKLHGIPIKQGILTLSKKELDKLSDEEVLRLFDKLKKQADDLADYYAEYEKIKNKQGSVVDLKYKQHWFEMNGVYWGYIPIELFP